MVTHSHTHGPTAPAPARLGRLLAAIIVPLAVLSVVGLIALWPHGHRTSFATGTRVVHGRVTALRLQSCTTRPVPPAPGTRQCGTATVAVTDGPDAGHEVTVNLPQGPAAPTVEVGDRLVLTRPTAGTSTGATTQYTIVDHQRGRPLLLFAILFCAVVIGFGRWRGLAALGGLALSLALVLAFIMPAIAGGESPLLVATVGSAAIVIAAFYLTNGVSVETSVAVLGTLLSLLLTGLLATAAVAATKLTGFGTEEAGTLPVLYPRVDVHGLLLAGIIIGSLGILNDVTVTQAATVTELAAADPHMSRPRLYRAAERIGRAHIASTVNTIILAYTGASLPLILLITANQQSIATTLTSQFVAQEIVRSIAGTIGLVAAVPLTTGLAAAITAGAYPDSHPDAQHAAPAV